MTGAAGQVELTLAAGEELASALACGLHARVRRRFDRHAARLMRDVGRQCEKFGAFPRKWRRLLVIAAALLDALFEIERPRVGVIENRITRRDTLHADARIAMTIGAGVAIRSRLGIPQRL